MEDRPITSFTVGQPFPGVVPHREGAIMELWEIGLVILIQYPRLRPRRRHDQKIYQRSGQKKLIANSPFRGFPTAMPPSRGLHHTTSSAGGR